MKLKYKVLLVCSKRLPFLWCRNYFLNKMVTSEGGWAFSNTIREYYKDKYKIEIGYGSYGGCFNISYIPSGVKFGNYCSIAEGVKIFRANHPMQYFTMHPLFYNPTMGYVKKDTLNRPNLEIGNDVWIGANSIILPSCKKIGNGAVIAAGSIVTHNIEPYTIVGGNPAIKIKERFNPAQIAFLERTKWWNLNRDDLVKKHDDIQEQLESLYI